MAFFGPSPLKRFTPKEIKLSQIYQQATKLKSLPQAAKIQIASILKKAGYDSSHLNKIINQDKAIGTGKMREILNHLNKSGVQGFDLAPKKAIEKYLRHETIKRKNIARIRNEHIKEARQENLNEPRSRPASRRQTNNKNLKFPY